MQFGDRYQVLLKLHIITTKKKIIPIIIGEIIFPKIIPNLNHILFKGDKIFELKRPKTRKIRAIIKDHILTSLLFNKGYKAINKKTIKKTIPKLLFEPSLMLSI